MATGGDAPLRVAIVGLRMGAIMLDTLRRDARAQVVALCDPLEERLNSLADRSSIRGRYADYETMLEAEQLDGVCISTPNHLHASMVRAALERGLHVLCEKPLALNAASAWELVDLARAAGVTHGVNFSNRPNPAVRFVQQELAAGSLGLIREIHLSYQQDWLADPDAPYSWKNSSAMSGSGSLGDIGSHVLDLGRLFVGEITAVAAQLAVVTPERPRSDGTLGVVDADDLASLLLQFANGALGTVRVSRIARGCGDLRRVELFGERASLILEIDSDVVRVWRADEATTRHGKGFRAVFVHDARRSTWGENTLAWLEAALERRPMSPNFEDGARVQEILDATLQAHAERRWVEIRR